MAHCLMKGHPEGIKACLPYHGSSWRHERGVGIDGGVACAAFPPRDCSIEAVRPLVPCSLRGPERSAYL